ncbi:magnesium/cobalt transporter CorA [Paenibacillus sp. BSR1-1]|uniref:magnesium/cobalt transporter CorA n=1 Tax=Paenibacillus sp. BSR1-1 TaxID=3020845 RepID=UPI0025B0F21D|nr:magnesium/cobalt transporter CorA [Paenibacillus sp. BSR1-1]MDN3015224.1 magnesium/cobalt transporter CorA [Paenibacillus sp. BSR1-1]
MISFMGITQANTLVKQDTIDKLALPKYKRFWVDFNEPTDEEIKHLSETFNFHPLAIEDCVNTTLQRPKLDYYDEYTFFITHIVREERQEIIKEELEFFVGENYIVTFHLKPSLEVSQVVERLTAQKSFDKFTNTHVFYEILDKIVDNYFPIIYKIEDKLDEIEDNTLNKPMNNLLKELFETRYMLLNLTHTVNPMRDLLYRMLNSQHLKNLITRKEYYSDIYDHLLKLSEMLMANREITADIRDNYLSLNSHQTNNVMKVLTIMTSIFAPLTLIAGIFGMNFKNMPELDWKYGYGYSLVLMGVIGLSMFLWFKKKGWF